MKKHTTGRLKFTSDMMLEIEDTEGDHWVIQPSWTGGLEIMAYDPSESEGYYHAERMLVYPESASTVHIRHLARGM